ncbi:aminotransferase class III-fold pyridoxal phosphate-dependent enzyme [Xinfangfangia sp. CPCC 101601]|uniref:Aminotransferase class III-fold pyridoxal phosphate-dependent enzyme n=1 Tax=Pseudogemmobacter lacusdianii TaxID=3069608 RepID=A0ABU0VZT0_9RHOB|nr:aminotransferase class III-fold pyridoxal phosphate-dependent enzyme [Xinfangfangia sp. CPCC 101601]MDQ2066700.1 aminotransferase class III-fold pyridoxal phosphate-dependent enzyme [Xinfangfangia sp. CPCC 101601]
MSQPNHRPSTLATTTLPKVVRAKGSYLWDANGKQYIDGSGGPAVYSIGHANEEVNAAIIAQLQNIAHGYRYNFTTDALEELTEILRDRCGGDLREMVYVTGGSEAVESCLKIALQYQTAIGQKSRRIFISRERSWHGNTFGSMGVSGFVERTVAYEGAFIPSVKLSPANEYRPIAGATAETAGAAAAAELEAAILRLGPEKVAAFIFEPVVGAAGGCVPAPPGYAAKVREICSRYGVLMISDEVMSGAGRTGTWRALAYDGVEPDIMSVAKGLAAGYQPLGVAIYSTKIHEAIIAADGAIGTGHTFTGHTTACAAGVAVQKIIQREGLLDRVKANGPRLKSWLGEALAGVDAIGDIRGRGHFICAELVANRATKAPFPAERKLFAKIRAQAMQNGLICYPVGGNVDGVNGDIVIFAPPYNCTDAELTEIVDKGARSIREVLTAEGLA